MASPAKKPTRKRIQKQADTPLENPIPFDLVFQDFHVVSLSCERLLPPHIGAGGSYKVAMEPAMLANKNGSKEGPVVIEYKFSLEGKKETENSETGKMELAKTFSIALKAQALFMLVGSDKCDNEHLESLFRSALKQGHVLAVHKLREAAAGLGYLGVRPAFGLADKKIAIIEKVS